jgi:hypothetical protein
MISNLLNKKKQLLIATTKDLGMCLMKSWFCIWDDLLRLFAIARVANPKIGLNLVPDPL